MRKLALAASILLLAVFAACGSDSGESNTVATPPDDYGTTSEPAASGAQAEINDKGTKTFTDEAFEVELELDNFYFEPTFIKSPGGSTATMKLHNEGTVQHNFTVEGLDIDQDLGPGEEKTLTVEIGTETRYDFFCKFHKDQGMRGAFQPH
jgi:plastocyanin